jgi:hypothetical protein
MSYIHHSKYSFLCSQSFLLLIFLIKLWLFIYTALTGFRFWGRHCALCQITYLVTILNKLIFLLNSFFTSQQHLMAHGRHNIEASRSNSDTLQSVGLLWTSDQPVAQTSTLQRTTHNRQISIPQPWFEPTIPAGELLQNHAWDRVTTHPKYFPHTHTHRRKLPPFIDFK